MYQCVFFAHRHFFLFRPRAFSRALGSVARREPARTPRARLGLGKGPQHVLWGFKLASPLEEGFRARTAIQVRPTAHVISGILNVINAVRRYLLGDGKGFPRHQHARHATTFSRIR